MINLAIECSGTHGSVAVTQSQELLVLIQLPTNKSSVQSLSSTVVEALRGIKERPDLLSVTSGPGSFTGLRVGLATAKMLGMAWKIPIVPIDTLEVMAVQMLNRIPYHQCTTLIPVMNAFRGQVFTAAWHPVSSESIIRLSPTQVIDAPQWQSSPLRSQKPLDGDTPTNPVCKPVVSSRNKESRIVVAGPGLDRYPPTAPSEEDDYDLEMLENLTPQADCVARLGDQLFQANSYTSPAHLSANYVRSSSAEEKLPK